MKKFLTTIIAAIMLCAPATAQYYDKDELININV